jgi:hypothetical protein
MLKREILYPVGILAGGVLFGAVAAAFSNNPAWPIAIVLALIVIVTLAFHVNGIAAATGNREAGKVIVTRGHSTMIATGLIVIGIALLLGTCAPSAGRHGAAFTVWLGFAALLMGVVLSYAMGLVGNAEVLSAEVTLLRGTKKES